MEIMVQGGSSELFNQIYHDDNYKKANKLWLPLFTLRGYFDKMMDNSLRNTEYVKKTEANVNLSSVQLIIRNTESSPWIAIDLICTHENLIINSYLNDDRIWGTLITISNDKKKIFRALQMLIVIVSLQKKHKRLLVLAWHVCEEVSRNLKYKFTIFQYLRSVNV